MQKILLSFLVAITLSVSGWAQKTVNDPNAEKREASGFTAIEVSGGIDLFLSQGNEAVAVSASETQYRDRIKTEVKNGVLKIWYEHQKGNITIDWGNRKMKAYVSYKDLGRLNGSGGSDISVEGTIKAGKFELHISGGADFEGKVDIGDMSVDATGGSDVKISGAVKNLDVEVSGGSDLKGYELTADVCNLRASGGSDVYITVNKELSANASGGSDIFYKGSGTVKEMKSSGSSSIKKASR